MSQHRDEYKRNDLGQFSKGTKGGCGNPHARSVAKLKTKMLEVIDEDKLEQYILGLFEMAMDGDHQAGKMLLLYLLGKPATARDPDQVDRRVESAEAGKHDGGGDALSAEQTRSRVSFGDGACHPTGDGREPGATVT